MEEIGDKPISSFDQLSTNTAKNIGLQFFAQKPSDFKTVRLRKDEYAHVMSELATWAAKEQRSKQTFRKCIGKYKYTVENMKDGSFRIIKRVKL